MELERLLKEHQEKIESLSSTLINSVVDTRNVSNRNKKVARPSDIYVDLEMLYKYCKDIS